MMEAKQSQKVALKRNEVIALLREKPMTLMQLDERLSFSHTKIRVIIKYLREHNVVKARIISPRHFIFSLLPESKWECDPFFVPQKPIYDEEPAVPPAPTFADGMTAEDDRRFLELTNDLTHNVKVTGSPVLSASPRGLPGSTPDTNGEQHGNN